MTTRPAAQRHLVDGVLLAVGAGLTAVAAGVLLGGAPHPLPSAQARPVLLMPAACWQHLQLNDDARLLLTAQQPGWAARPPS